MAAQEYHNPNAADPNTNKARKWALGRRRGRHTAFYTRPADRSSDDGRGFIVQTDQIASEKNGFLFFDRKTWKYPGTVCLSGVENTNGIATTQKARGGYPLGLFAAIDEDTA